MIFYCFNFESKMNEAVFVENDKRFVQIVDMVFLNFEYIGYLLEIGLDEFIDGGEEYFLDYIQK